MNDAFLERKQRHLTERGRRRRRGPFCRVLDGRGSFLIGGILDKVVIGVEKGTGIKEAGRM